MSILSRGIALLCLVWCTTAWAADPHKLESFRGTPPKGLSEKVLAQLGETAYRVSGPNGPVLEVWFVKEVPVLENFKPSLTVKYPFASGQLLGVVALPTAGAALDFRGQELPAGVFTLRYGLQPQDGNHLGTSDVSDFGLACAAELDQDPVAISDIKSLFKISAKAAGSAHPAIFQLAPPPTEPYAETVLQHNDDKDLWILRVNLISKTKAGPKPLPVQLVTIGTSGG